MFNKINYRHICVSLFSIDNLAKQDCTSGCIKIVCKGFLQIHLFGQIV